MGSQVRLPGRRGLLPGCVRVRARLETDLGLGPFQAEAETWFAVQVIY